MPKVIIRGDSRHLPLLDSSVDCVVTSPPYWGLRDYGYDDQIGLEASPDEYTLSLVRVFDEVRRVLKPSGVVWLNLGDTYAGNRGYQVPDNKHRDVGNARPMTVSRRRDDAMIPRSDTLVVGVQPKNLIGIPWKVAFALQQAGWYLRSDIIWSKPNPMPESVTDRPTKAHEYVFLLSKSERYYYDAAAIAEPLSEVSLTRYARVERNQETYDPSRHKHGESLMHNSPMEILTRAAKGVVERGTRNKRSVWTVPTMPYAGAHFATMPEDLVQPCILAGCPLGGLVLDPFAGSGTVLAVAQRLGRRAVGVELAPHYLPLMQARTAQRGLVFGERDNGITEQPEDVRGTRV